MFNFMRLFGGKSDSSSEQAHKRLKFVLIHDRANVSPEIMEHIKNDIIKVISNYMEIDMDFGYMKEINVLLIISLDFGSQTIVCHRRRILRHITKINRNGYMKDM